MYHVSAQGVDERMINVHYYYFVTRLYDCAVGFWDLEIQCSQQVFTYLDIYCAIVFP